MCHAITPTHQSGVTGFVMAVWRRKAVALTQIDYAQTLTTSVHGLCLNPNRGTSTDAIRLARLLREKDDAVGQQR